MNRVVLTEYYGDQVSRDMVGRKGRIKKHRTQDKVAVSENRYNLRPRCGREVEFRPALEMKTQQGGPVRSRKSRGRNDNPYKIRQQEYQTERVTDLEVYAENSGVSLNLNANLYLYKGQEDCEKAEL
ncbi:hypothetical protein TNCV_3505141 [Trichonephila clavipes]|uniref:Uncharacterized protein n=1 Tax=Trichonephila clavipes TaxID=2585209 RepID=A0A8X6VCP7_TRICX|nr:hypothetical protein TNCV_3505141 [Trichonephila clavipes]